MTTAATEAAYTAPPQLLFLSSRAPDRIQWTEERVLRRIHERQRSDLILNCKGVRQEDPRLLSAARHRFGSWASALQAAGLSHVRRDPPPRAYTRESIIACLREHVAAGLPATSKHPLLRGCPHAARQLFGSWAMALEIAGVKPTEMAAKRGLYTREYIISRLREHVAASLPVSSDHPRLRAYWKAARRLFGSWSAALAAAGIKPAKLPAKQAPYTREYIISGLREHAAAGLPVSSDHPRLRSYWKAARRLFGSWAAALEAAGVKPSELSVKRSLYTRAYIISRLREHTATDMPILSGHPLLRSLAKPAQRRFGSWAAALEAAGLTSARKRRREASTPERGNQ